MRSEDLYLRIASEHGKADIDLVAICIIMTERRFRRRSFRAMEYLILIVSIMIGKTRYRTTIGMGQLRYELWLERYGSHTKSLFASLKSMENYRMCKSFVDATGRGSIADILKSYNGTSNAIYSQEFARHFAHISLFHSRFIGFPKRYS
jgi:hypothetical protein